MEIKLLHTGPLGVNTLIVPLAERYVFVVDPASCAFCDDENIVASYLAQEKLEPVAIVLTHGHFDHVAGLPFLRKVYPNIPILIHKDDAEMIGADSGRLQGASLAQMGFYDFTPSVTNLPEPTAFLQDGKTLADALPAEKTWKLLWARPQTVMRYMPRLRNGACFIRRDTQKGRAICTMLPKNC